MAVPKQVRNGLSEAVAFYSTNVGGGRAFEIQKIDGKFIKSIRRNLKLSQSAFAIKFGFSLKTLQKWEANYRVPEGPARAYLMVISEIPDEIAEALFRASIGRVTETSKQ